MRNQFKIYTTLVSALLFFCSYTMVRAANESISKTNLDMECVLTNAHVTIQIPHAAHIEQRRITQIGIYNMAPAGAKFVSGSVYRDYKVMCDVTIESEKEFQHNAQFFQTEDFQEHTNLITYDVPIGKQLRKDIRDSERHWILSISANVEKTNAFLGRETGTFQEDIEMAKKMIESIKLIKMQPNETDILNPLSVVEVERIKKEIGNLQPYMTPSDCLAALGISKREIDSSVWGRNGLIRNHGGIIPEQGIASSDWQTNENQKVFFALRKDHFLLLNCDGRGYVISAKLDENKWQWPNLKESSAVKN
jgi:hypothetical protein